MVVTDLHGDGELYERYRDLFLELRERGQAETLVLTGDFIHSEGPEEYDESLEITLDLMLLQRELGESLVVLLGNHELPHLYHVPLAKGQTVYTPRFEAALGEYRNAVLGFFARCPFFARTRAGVTLCHAGGFPEAADPAARERLFTLSHRALMLDILAQIPEERRAALRAEIGRQAGITYDVLSKHYLAVTGPADPRYDDYLVGVFAGQRPDFNLLWSAFFNSNERDYGAEAYAVYVAALLEGLSADYVEQRVLVAGHVGCRNGYEIVAQGRQLRLASGAHARPYESGRYLLFDAGKPVDAASALLPGLKSVF